MTIVSLSQSSAKPNWSCITRNIIKHMSTILMLLLSSSKKHKRIMTTIKWESSLIRSNLTLVDTSTILSTGRIWHPLARVEESIHPQSLLSLNKSRNSTAHSKSLLRSSTKKLHQSKEVVGDGLPTTQWPKH
jgi:hypothetical protein